jgi:hypothetical protein
MYEAAKNHPVKPLGRFFEVPVAVLLLAAKG